MRWVAEGRIANPSYLTDAACPPLSRARIWKGRMKTDRIFGLPGTFHIIGKCGTDRESIPRRSSRLARRGCGLLNSTAAAIRDGRCSTQPGKSAASSRTVWFPRESLATPCRALAGDSRKQLQTADRPVEQVEGLEQLIANAAAEGIDGRFADARDPDVFRDLHRAHGLGRVLCRDSLPRWIACAISFSLRTSSIEEDLLRLPPPQPGTTGVMCVETFARTDLGDPSSERNSESHIIISVSDARSIDRHHRLFADHGAPQRYPSRWRAARTVA